MESRKGYEKNEDYHIVDRKVIPTDSQEKVQTKIAETIAEKVCRLADADHIKPAECKCARFACPGTVDAEEGIVLYSNNLKWEQLRLFEIMRRYISAPMRLANDADTATLGEVLAGAAKGRKNAILLTLGTGVGGIILDGKIFHGYMKGGCELGHIVIRRGGKLCTCGRKGCFEQYVSASALMDAGRKAAGKTRDCDIGGRSFGSRAKI